MYIMKIVIPSYNRDTIKTLDHLKNYDVYIFVVEEEYDKYLSIYPEHNIIVGVKGIMNQRNFITDYFDDGEILVCMDDDIINFYPPLDEFLKKDIDYLIESKCGLMTYPPTYMYLDRRRGYEEGNYFGVGVFHILKNDKSIKLSVEYGEDIERSILYYKKHGTIRSYNGYFKTKYGASGGNNPSKETIIHSYNTLCLKYNNYIRLRDKPNVSLIKSPKEKPVIQLCYYECFDKLYELFKEVKLRYRDKTTNRKGFPKYRGAVFGLVRPRFKYKGYLEPSYDSKTFPKIHDELMRIGKIICPFEFTSIQVNNNLTCPPHKDSNNTGVSMLVSFGDYTGSNIVVNNKSYCAKNRPIIFDGCKYEHYNTDDLVGDKYSLVFFNRNEL